ncbi:MAG: nuclear transport factor 2 family protein [Hyphomonadaceae bacterium]|nr:nuclear transport factor 2 family protein [Hyphomonadaceae bacterium]
MSNVAEGLLRDLADREAIRERIYRYCRAVDRLDVPLGRSIFHEDAQADYEMYKGPGRDAINWICERHLDFLNHSHQVSNILIDLDGDSAGSEAYVTATLRTMRTGKLQQITYWCRYIDKWSRRGGVWGIDNRQVMFDLDEVRDIVELRSRERRGQDDPSYAVMRAFA